MSNNKKDDEKKPKPKQETIKVVSQLFTFSKVEDEVKKETKKKSN